MHAIFALAAHLGVYYHNSQIRHLSHAPLHRITSHGTFRTQMTYQYRDYNVKSASKNSIPLLRTQLIYQYRVYNVKSACFLGRSHSGYDFASHTTVARSDHHRACANPKPRRARADDRGI